MKPLDSQWKGYTLEELRYQRLSTRINIELEKERLQQRLPSLNPIEMVAPTLVRVVRSVKYIDLIIIVIRLLRRIFGKGSK